MRHIWIRTSVHDSLRIKRTVIVGTQIYVTIRMYGKYEYGITAID